MARGDVVSGIASIAAGAEWVFQPPIGVEVLITEAGSGEWEGATPNRTPHISVRLFDGTRRSTVRSTREATYWGGGTLKLFITNSLYLEMRNHAGFSVSLTYSGIQTK